MPETAIRTENLTRAFDAVRAVDDLTLEVPRGKIFGFLGPNGAGKTTTLRLLLGLLEPSRGRAQVLGLDTQTQADEIRARTGALLEPAGLYERLSATDNLEFFARIWRVSAAARQARNRSAPYAGCRMKLTDLICQRPAGGQYPRSDCLKAELQTRPRRQRRKTKCKPCCRQINARLKPGVTRAAAQAEMKTSVDFVVRVGRRFLPNRSRAFVALVFRPHDVGFQIEAFHIFDWPKRPVPE